VKVVYNGVDIDEFNPDISGVEFRKFLKVKDEILVGMVGQIIPQKGVEVFLKSSSEVLKHFKDVKFILIGKGNEKYMMYLRKLINTLRIRDYVRITGFIRNIPEAIAALDIVVNASDEKGKEGLSRSLLEAMATGKPVIATSVGGNIELVDDGINGILVRPSFFKELSNAILKLLKDKNLRKRMGKKAREKVVKFFNIKDCVQKIKMIYREII